MSTTDIITTITSFITVGIPDPPMLNNILQSAHSNNSGLMFNFDVLQSGTASSCVVKYNIMITGIGCNYTHTKLVDVIELNATYNTVSVGALPVCCEEYEFRVSGMDRSNRKYNSCTSTNNGLFRYI